MKKLLRTIFIIFFAEFIIVSCLVLYFAHSTQADYGKEYGVYNATYNLKPNMAPVADKTTVESDPEYNIEAEVKVQGESILISEDIFFDGERDKIGLYIPSANIAETKIYNVVSDGTVTGILKKETYIEIELEEPSDSIKVVYEILPEADKQTLSHNKDGYYLTNFLITPFVYKDGQPVYTLKKSFGDPYIYEINNYHVTFKTENNLKIYAPGKTEEEITDEYRITTFEASNIRDFPAVLLYDADVYVEKLGNVNLHFINSKEASTYVKEAFSFAESNIGYYPYEDFFVVKAPISINGMEFSNMIFLSDRCFGNPARLKNIAYHEVFHQWFYGIIGTDQLNEPFLDEGLVDYLATCLTNGKTRQWKGKDLKKPLKDYTNVSEYYNLAYYDSAAYFYTIHQKLGNNFYRLLSDIYNEWKFKILYFDDFQQLVNNY